jgi:hypothetical protein
MDPTFLSIADPYPDPQPCQIFIQKKSKSAVEPLYEKHRSMNSCKLQLTSNRITMAALYTLGEGGEQLSGGLWTQQEGG